MTTNMTTFDHKLVREIQESLMSRVGTKLTWAAMMGELYEAPLEGAAFAARSVLQDALDRIADLIPRLAAETARADGYSRVIADMLSKGSQ